MTIKDQIPTDEMRWYAVQCKFRCEKSLMKELNDQGITTYVPILKKVKQYISKRKVTETALIPSHVFVHIDRSQYIPVLQHYHVYRFLNFSGKILAIPQSEMDLMRRVAGEYDNVMVDTSAFTAGDRVQIIGGQLTGVEGSLLEATNHNFKIELSTLGMGLIIYVDPKHLMKIGSQKQVA